MERKRETLLVASVLLCSGTFALAEPSLQLFLEGATYVNDTWVLEGANSALRLWVIGQSPVYDVKLAVAYEAGLTPSISLTGSTTGGLGGFVDPSVASDPVYLQTGADGSTPKLGDGSDLPAHGVYQPGVVWQEFSLGDFDLHDSPIADFITSFPEAGTKTGQINVYNVSVSGATWLHFDVYDHVVGAVDAKYVNAPFSHDAGVVPAPAAALLGLIGLGVVGMLRRQLA